MLIILKTNTAFAIMNNIRWHDFVSTTQNDTNNKNAAALYSDSIMNKKISFAAIIIMLIFCACHSSKKPMETSSIISKSDIKDTTISPPKEITDSFALFTELYRTWNQQTTVLCVEKKEQPQDSVIGDSTDCIIKLDAAEAQTIDTASRKKGSLILITGDSMADCLTFAFSRYCKRCGHAVKVVSFISTSTEQWATHKYVSRLIAKYHPALVILCLGGNEYYLPKRAIRGHAPHIKSIIEQADSVPLIWVGPPNLQVTKELDTVVTKAIGKDRYFPSSNLVLDKKSDGQHPSWQASIVWADTIARWIQLSSTYHWKVLPEKTPAKSMYVYMHYAAVAQARSKALCNTLGKADSQSVVSKHL